MRERGERGRDGEYKENIESEYGDGVVCSSVANGRSGGGNSIGLGRCLRCFDMNIADSDRFGEFGTAGRDADRDRGERGA